MKVVVLLGLVAACGDNRAMPDAAPSVPPDAPAYATFALDSTDHDFGDVAVAHASTAAVFVVRNTGTGPGPGATPTLVGTAATDYAIATDACTGATLAPGATCEVGVTVQPTKLASVEATLRVGQSYATLHARGVPASAFQLSPAMVSFGSRVPGATTAPVRLTLTTSGVEPTGPFAVALGNANQSDFPIVADTCTGQTLAPGAQCTIDIVFDPTAAGTRSAQVDVSATAGGVRTTPLTGTGVPLTPSATLHDYGTVLLTETSAPATLTFTNPTSFPSGTLHVDLPGTDFHVTTTTCEGSSLAPSASCDVSVTVHPTALGARGATLSVGGASVSLAANGLLPPMLVLAPNPAVVDPTAPTPFTLTNPSGASHGPIQLALSGPDATDFAIVNDLCSNQTLAPGAQCTFAVTLTPTLPGTENAVVTATTPTETATAALSGS